jgi:hypothetical protein
MPRPPRTTTTSTTACSTEFVRHIRLIAAMKNQTSSEVLDEMFLPALREELRRQVAALHAALPAPKPKR